MAETIVSAATEAILTLFIFGGATLLGCLVHEALKMAWKDTHHD